MTAEEYPQRCGDGAILSSCRSYRYCLWRQVDAEIERRCAFIMLNPSTADERENDPTIRKCVGFASRWGYGAIDVVNLFAWRSTEPRALLQAPDAVGPENWKHVTTVVYEAARVVLAWGSHASVRGLIRNQLLSPHWFVIRTLWKAGTLGRNQDGEPKHPLMLAYSTPFVGLSLEQRNSA
jgi:hypothetical protein